MNAEKIIEKIISEIKETYSQGYSFYLGRYCIIYNAPDRKTIYRNEIEKMIPIDKIIQVLKETFPNLSIFYDDINEAIRVRSIAE